MKRTDYILCNQFEVLNLILNSYVSKYRTEILKKMQINVTYVFNSSRTIILRI